MVMQIGFSSKQNTSASFGSLKPQKRVCEQVVKEFKQEFPYLQSSSKLGCQLYKHWNDPKYDKVISGLYKKFEKLNEQIYDHHYSRFFTKGYESYSDFIHSLRTNMRNKGKANCWEDSVLVHHALEKKGLNPQNIEMIVETNEGGGNHFMSVVGLKKGANLRDPKTWGSQAMIVDAWHGVVLKAKDGIEYFKGELSKKNPVIGVSFKNADPKMTVNAISLD